jgi:prefoldin subunit 5
MKNIFNKNNIFVFLMSISTLILAGSAAYYSVFGLSSLFAGARFEVIILAGALEFSKLIVASYLHNNWRNAGWMKYYLSLAVFVLMIITSAGIYGFLTSAYQKTSDDVTMMNKRISVVELKKERFNTQLTMLVSEKNQLSNSISDLSKGLSNNVIQYRDRETGQIITTTSSSTRRALKQELEESKEQRNKISQKIESLTDSVTNLDFEILEIQSSSDAVSEIGTLRYTYGCSCELVYIVDCICV